MELLSLPTEIFEKILQHAILVRGLKRGLRLRLVNRVFATAIMQTIFTYQLLDNHAHENCRYMPSNLFASYIEYRLKQKPTAGSPWLTCLQRVVSEIHQHSDNRDPDLSTVDSCIQKLCSSLARFSSRRFLSIFSRKANVTEAAYENELLAAAICTNNLSIVRRCSMRDGKFLFETYTSSSSSFFFGSYLELAGKHGNAELFEYLMTRDGSTVNMKIRAYLFAFSAKADRLEMVHLIHNFRIDEMPWSFVEGPLYDTIYIGLSTSSVGILRLIEELCAENKVERPETYKIGTRMVKSARTGVVDMVLYLLQVLTKYEGYRDSFEPDAKGSKPIEGAAYNGHFAVVEILLEDGADPEVAIRSASSRGRKEVVQKLLYKGISPRGALAKAARGGYLETALALLDAGADVNESIGTESPLASAIALEHTTLFNLLLERGASLETTGTAEECVRRAKEDGLESMLLVLKERGVKIN